MQTSNLTAAQWQALVKNEEGQENWHVYLEHDESIRACIGVMLENDAQFSILSAYMLRIAPRDIFSKVLLQFEHVNDDRVLDFLSSVLQVDEQAATHIVKLLIDALKKDDKIIYKLFQILPVFLQSCEKNTIIIDELLQVLDSKVGKNKQLDLQVVQLFALCLNSLHGQHKHLLLWSQNMENNDAAMSVMCSCLHSIIRHMNTIPQEFKNFFIGMCKRNVHQACEAAKCCVNLVPMVPQELSVMLNDMVSLLVTYAVEDGIPSNLQLSISNVLFLFVQAGNEQKQILIDYFLKALEPLHNSSQVMLARRLLPIAPNDSISNFLGKFLDSKLTHQPSLVNVVAEIATSLLNSIDESVLWTFIMRTIEVARLENVDNESIQYVASNLLTKLANYGSG